MTIVVGKGGGNGPSAKPAVPAWHPPAGARTDAQTSGPDYGTAAANAFKQSPAYHQAVVKVFDHQSDPQKTAIARGALRTPSLEGNIVLEHIRQQAAAAHTKPNWRAGTGPTIQAGPLLGPLDLIVKPAQALAGVVAKGLGDVRQATSPGAVTQGVGASIGSGPIAAKVAANTAKDLVTLPAETISTLGTIGGDVLTGKPGKALSDFTSPYAQLARDPQQAFIAHPLLSTLMATGAFHGATRLAAAPVRALANPEGVVGRALSTRREGVALTGKLTHERPAYSKSPSIKASQKAVEGQLYKRAANGDLVPRTAFVRDKLIRSSVGQLFSARERIRRVNREATVNVRESAVRPPLPARVGHSLKTALAYGPQRAAIRGAGAYARIADLTVRRPTPESFSADLGKHLAQVSANRPRLLDRPDLLKEHDLYVKQMQRLVEKPPSAKQLSRLFAAAERNRQEFAPVQEGLRQFGHFGAGMTREGLARRELQHYAVTHMGARFDEERGLLQSVRYPAIQSQLARLRGQESAVAAVLRRPGTEGERVAAKAALARVHARLRALPPATGEAPLSTAAILEHLRGPEGTGGRLPLYTPDRPRSGSAFYVNSERMPLPATARNTLFAYTHGLTEPGHEALTEEHVLKQGILDAYNSQREYLDQLHVQKPGGGYWPTYTAAKADLRGTGLRPINISQPFHPQESLDKALEGVHPATVEEEAARHGLDLSERMRSDSPGGRWAAIHPAALDALKEQQGMVSPNKWMRIVRGLNTQFRSVALSTSPKHVPGIIQEGLIRDIAYGVGFRSWLNGQLIKGVWKRDLGQAGAREMRARYTGGQQAGMTEFAATHTTAEHYRGTNMYPVLKGWEQFVKSPGPRQLRTAWLAWSHVVIRSTKKAIEEQQQIASIGKHALSEHGYAEALRTQGFLGAVQRLLVLHGKMLDDAARGLYDPAKGRQARAFTTRVLGNWTDLTPTGKTAVMFSPFGLWWINSARFLARMPVDQPIKTSLLASATVGSEKERQAHGLDMFMRGALPLYEQGGIPAGGKIIAQNYYSPFGIANDPLQTAQGLIAPWAAPLLGGAAGVDWLGRPLSSPGNPRGSKTSSVGERVQYVLDSMLASFVPLYTKAQQVLEGGASPYDVSPGGVLPPLLRGRAPATKTPGRGVLAGVEKATLPLREYKAAGSSGSSGGWGGSSGSSSGGWGGSTGSSRGWG